MTTGIFAVDTFPSVHSPACLNGATMSWASPNGRRIDYVLALPHSRVSSYVDYRSAARLQHSTRDDHAPIMLRLVPYEWDQHCPRIRSTLRCHNTRVVHAL